MSALNTDSASCTSDATQLLKQLERLSGHSSRNCERMLQSPVIFKDKLQISIAFRNSSFTLQEQQLILMTIDQESGRDYSRPSLSREAEICQLPAFISKPIKSDKPIESEKLQALRQFTSQVFTLQGRVNQRMVNEYLAAGYNSASVEDLLSGICQTVLRRLTSISAKTPWQVSSNCETWQQIGPACLPAECN